jgi:hypothetical protein
MACHQIAARRDNLQVWRLAAIILNKQSRMADEGWFSGLRVKCLAETLSGNRKLHVTRCCSFRKMDWKT